MPAPALARFFDCPDASEALCAPALANVSQSRYRPLRFRNETRRMDGFGTKDHSNATQAPLGKVRLP